MTKKRISYAKLYMNDSELIYQIRHSNKAKYLRLQINPATGLEVVLPYGCNLGEAERFVNKKKEWILKHFKPSPAAERYTYLGAEIRIKQRYDLFLKKHKIILNKDTLMIDSPAGAPDDINFIFNAWLKHKAKIYLPERTEYLAGQYNFSFKRLSLRNQKTRWGSCSASGNISLNYRLMRYRKEIIDYVIIHELCHLKELNHSKDFWELVESLVPDYKSLKRELKSHYLLKE